VLEHPNLFSTLEQEPKEEAKHFPVQDPVWRTSGQLLSLNVTAVEELATIIPMSSLSGWRP